MKNGTYYATLFDASVFRDEDGRRGVRFTWTLDGQEERVSSELFETTKTGCRDFTGIAFTRGWAKDWQGDDVGWFERNLDLCRTYRARVNVENDRVTFVMQMKPDEIATRVSEVMKESHQKYETMAKLTRHPERIADIPNDIEPCATSAYGIFEMLTDGSDRWDQATVWIAMAADIGPLQFNFTQDEWRLMIEKIIKLVDGKVAK